MPGDCVFAVLSILQIPFGPHRFRKKARMSGRMQRAMEAMGFCGMPELLMSFLRLPKIVLLCALGVDYKGVLGVLISNFMINGLSSL